MKAIIKECMEELTEGKSFTNKDYGITSTVNKTKDGKFSVSLKDDDSNETLQQFRIYPNEPDAIAYAKLLVK